MEQIYDMSNAFIEHSLVINNFVTKLGSQIKDSLCRVLSDGVQYQWKNVSDKIYTPDASINCNFRDRSNTCLNGIPRMVMEVLSNSTESYDRNEKMEAYCKAGISEYWIVDWRTRKVEVYLNEPNEDGTSYWHLQTEVTEDNKADLKLIMMPNLKITFDELFDIE